MPRRHLRLKPLLLSLLITPTLLLSNPSFATDYFKEAQAYNQAGDAKAAMIQLKNLLQQSPDHAEGRLLLGDIYLNNNQYAEAEKELKRAQALGVDRLRVAPLLAEALLGIQQYDEALNSLFLDWGSEGPDQARRWALIGSARFGQKQLEEAENAFYQSIERQPNDLAQLGLALVAQAYGRADEALEYLNAITGDSREARRALLLRAELLRHQRQFGAAISTYAQVLDRDADNLSARLGRAQSALELQQLDTADTDIAYLLTKLPGVPQVRILAAISAIGHKDYKAANSHAQMVLQAQPNNPQGLLLAGTAYYHLQQPADAEAQLRPLLKQFPDHLSANRLLAATLLRQKKPREALALLEPLLAKGVTDPAIMALAGNAYLISGDLEAGEKLLTEAMNDLPKEGNLVNQIALSRALSGRSDDALSLLESVDTAPTLQSDTVRVVAMLRAGNRAEAIKLMQERIGSQPDTLQYRLMLALLHQQAGDLDAAKQAFSAALAVAPDNSAPEIGLARIALQQKQPDQAAAHFKRVLASNADHLGALLGMAAVSELRHDDNALVDWLKKARRQHPDAITPANALVGHFLRQGQSERALAESHNFYLDHQDHVDAAQLYASILRTTQSYDQARNVLQPVHEKNPDNPQVALALAESLKDLGKAAEALRITTPLVKKYGAYNPAGILHTELLIIDGQYPAAEALLSQLWERQQLPVLARLQVALSLQLQQYPKAQTFVEKIYPEQRDPKMLQMMIQIHLKQSGPAAAEAMLTKHLASYPEDGFALMQAASLAHQQGRVVDATARYEQLTKMQPTNPIPWNNLAWIYHQQGDPRGLTHAREAHRLAPDSADIQDTLGWILLQSGKKQEALDILRQAAKSRPDNAEVQFHYAQALIDNGNGSEARPLLETLTAQKSAFQPKAAALLRQLN